MNATETLTIVQDRLVAHGTPDRMPFSSLHGLIQRAAMTISGELYGPRSRDIVAAAKGAVEACLDCPELAGDRDALVDAWNTLAAWLA